METISTLLQTISNNNSAIADKQEEIYDKASGDGYTRGYEGGYNAGYLDGADSMGDGTISDKIIRTTASGISVMSVDDVSERKHTMNIQLSNESVNDFSEKTIYVYGNNLLDGSTRITSKTSYGLTIQYIPEEDCYLFNGSPTATTNYYQIKNPILIDGYVSFRSVVVSGTISNYENKNVYFYVGYSDTPDQAYTNWATCRIQENFVSRSSSAKKYLHSTWFYISKDVVFDNYKVKIQMERGKRSKEYTPFELKTYTPSIDGHVEVESVPHNATIVCDTGTSMELTYHKSWGMQNEYDKFWDLFQENGNRNTYPNAFSYAGWDDTVYNPKYPIKALSCNAIFLDNKLITDTKVDIDISGRYTNGTIQAFNMFQGCTKMKRIRKLIIGDDGVGSLGGNQFSNCTSLEELKVVGTTGKAVDLHWSPLLNKESIISVMSALSDTTANLVANLNTDAVNTAFETSSGAKDGSTSEEWQTLVATKPNWSIALATA